MVRTPIGGCDALEEGLGRAIHSCLRDYKLSSTTIVTIGATGFCDETEGRCWAVTSGYVKLLDPRVDGTRIIRLLVGRGGLFGDRPFGERAFRGSFHRSRSRPSPTAPPKSSRWIAGNLETASHAPTPTLHPFCSNR